MIWKFQNLSFSYFPDLDSSKFKITTEKDSMATVASDKAEQGVDSAAMEKQDEELDSKTWVLFFLMYLLFTI